MKLIDAIGKRGRTFTVLVAILGYATLVGLYALTGHFMVPEDDGALWGALTGLATPPACILFFAVAIPVLIAIHKAMYALLGEADPGFFSPPKHDEHHDCDW